MTDLFDAPLPPRKRRRQEPATAVNPDREIAEIIARAVFPLSWSESPVILREVTLGNPVDRWRNMQIDRCIDAVSVLRARGLLDG